jgi:hypothetical protein
MSARLLIHAASVLCIADGEPHFPVTQSQSFNVFPYTTQGGSSVCITSLALKESILKLYTVSPTEWSVTILFL